MERFLQGLTAGIIGFFLEGWMLMLFLGGVHHEVFYHINPIGYWAACFLSVPLDIMIVSYFALTSNRIDEIHKAVVVK